MNTNIYYRNNENPNVGFNRLSIANPFNYYSTNTYSFAPSRYSTISVRTPKPQFYKQYIIEEKKIGLKTNPNPKPMTNAYNLNTLTIITEQKDNPYYNPNNYPQRVDNVKDLMNYTYSERVPKYSSKTNPVITRFSSIPTNTITYQNIPIATRIPQTNINIYNTLINNNRNSRNYGPILDNTHIQQLINNNNQQIKNDNNLGNQYVKKVQQINNVILPTDIQTTNNLKNNIKNNQINIQYIVKSENPISQQNLKNNQGIGKLSEIISNSNSKEFHVISKGGLVKSYGYYEDSNNGLREYMEDQGKSIENLNGDPNKILFCLFDGHGGGEVSKFLQENFATYFKKMLPFKNYFAEITQLFKLLDEQIRLLNKPKVGSTATIVYIERQNGRKTLYCANVGDSRCVLVNRSGVMRLSYDDRVDDPTERARIIKQGGFIFNERVMGSLMLSRSFGDWDIKNFGVIAEPHITKVDITDDDLFIIIASDGVWDVIKDGDCLALTQTNIDTLEICKNIVVDALSKNSQDNLSCFVVRL